MNLYKIIFRPTYNTIDEVVVLSRTKEQARDCFDREYKFPKIKIDMDKKQNIENIIDIVLLNPNSSAGIIGTHINK